ncbi:helix-turn-helix domain-containing protein [Amycolatopsis kentuckyensis]|uniref:helix-turn-helix domain-containing protein n=1 Tax=Amycolatopsis kentuckyensis TaxID=218823 RepID=UPI003561D9F2
MATADDSGVHTDDDEAQKLQQWSAEIWDKLMTVPQATTVLKVNRATVFRLMNEGELPRVKFLRRTYVPVDEVVKCRDKQIDAARQEAERIQKKRTVRPRR